MSDGDPAWRQRARRRGARPRSQVPGSRHGAGWRGPTSIRASCRELRRRRQITDAAAVIAARIPGGCGAVATGALPPGHRVNRALVEALLTAIEEHDLMPVLDDDDRALNDDTDGDPDGVPFWMDHIPLRPCDDVYAYGWSEPPSPGEALLYLLFGREDDEDRDVHGARARTDLDDCIMALPTGDDRDAVTAAYVLALCSRDGALPMDALARVLTDGGGRFAAAGALDAAVPTLAAYIAGSTGNRFLDLDEEMAWYNGMYTMPWDPGVIVALMDEWAGAQDILTASAGAVVALREPAAVARLAGLLRAMFDDTPATH